MLGVVWQRPLREHDAQGWLVGGSVRDRQLGRFSPDIDVVVTGDACAISRALARALGAPWFTLSDEFCAYRVVGETSHVDVAAVRGGDILADLGQRDFSVNAMALPIGEGGTLGEVIDPFAGLADLRAMRLRAVSERVFSDDPLRLMRAARFAHVFGLLLDPPLRQAVWDQAAQIREAAPERTLTEMILTLDAGRAGDAVRLWDGLGLLRAVLPEVGGQGDIVALCASLDRLEGLLAGPASMFPVGGHAVSARLDEPVDGAFARPTALRLAGLLRDVDPGRAPQVGRRLKLSSLMMSLVETAARMARWGPLPAVAPSAARPGHEAVSFLWAAAPWEPEVILLAEAAQEGDPRTTGALLAAWAARASSGVPCLPFDGDDLMRELGLEPGPRLGNALRAARLVWEAGEATTTGQALAAARAALGESWGASSPQGLPRW